MPATNRRSGHISVRWFFDLNPLGTILPCQVFGKILAEAGRGGIILNISSMNAFRPLSPASAFVTGTVIPMDGGRFFRLPRRLAVREGAILVRSE